MAKKILIAEDDKFLANAYRVKLERAGFEVHLAYDGDEVFEILKTIHPDVILTDLIMPHQDGFVVIEKLQADPDLRGIPIIVASNLGQNEDVEKAKSLGAEAYVIKSDLALDDLISKINKVMEIKK